MDKVSFGSWAFIFGPHARNPVSLEACARMVAAAGYDGIEICGFPPHLTLEDYPTPASRRALRRYLDDLHLPVSGYVPDLTMVNLVVESNRDRYLDRIRHHVEVCADIGSPSLRVDTIAAPGSVGESEYGDAMKHIAAVWREAAEIAETAKIRLLWEFEPGFLFNKPSEVVLLYESVGHRNFYVLFDTCHAYLCSVVGARQQGELETLPGGVAAFLDMLSGRVGHVHIVDTDGTLYGEETSSHSLFGEGLIDFQKLAPKLKALPGVAWWCVDLAFRSDTEVQMKPSLDFVRHLLR